MNNIRLFFKESLSLNLNSILDKSQSHYLSKVMRIKTNESFSLFNQSGEWEAKVLDINKGIIEFIVVKKLRSAENEKEILSLNSDYANLISSLESDKNKSKEYQNISFLPDQYEEAVVRLYLYFLGLSFCYLYLNLQILYLYFDLILRKYQTL